MSNHLDLKYFADKRIPNEGPESRILFVGEAPGAEEYEQARPFVGDSGTLLINAMARAGLSRGDVRLANLCQFRPFNNKFEYLLGSSVLRDGCQEIFEYIARVRPNVVVALGAWPLFFLTGKKGIKKWRGSIISYVHDETIKVIPTIHPAAVLRDRGLYPTFSLDLRRIAGDAAFPEKRLPVRQFVLDPRGLELEEWTQKLCDAEFLGTDIETVKKSRHILCVGFAPSPDVGVCIVPGHHEGRRAIERILASPARKIFQFGQFDTTQLAENGYQVVPDPDSVRLRRPYFWDTMVAQHVMAPELSRSLEYLTSVYTREPYYKTEGRGTIPDDAKGWSSKINREALYTYNARDCCCTIEVALEQMEELKRESEGVQRTFDFEMRLIRAANHMALAGMYCDQERRDELMRVLLYKWQKKQFILDRLTGYETNVRSPVLKKILYEKMGLPPRRKSSGKDSGTLTTDEDAIVSLIQYCKQQMEERKRAETKLEWQIKLAICQTILEIRGIRQVLSNYVLPEMRDGTKRLGPDGRFHSIYKVPATESGRFSSTKYVDGSGFNAQTLPRDPVEIDEEVFKKIMADAEIERMKEQLAFELEEEENEEDEDMEEAA